MDTAETATAVFAPLDVDLRLRVVGGGSIAGDAACAATTCTRKLDGGSAVFLKAKAKKGWRFVAWSGACRGHGECSLTADTDVAVTATFAKTASKATPKMKQHAKAKKAKR
jgi:Fe-S cluster biogenesis protein NfuA